MSKQFPYQLTISLVVYNSKPINLLPLINSINQINLPVKLIVCDNSKNNQLQHFIQENKGHYIFNNANLGYGKAHNKAILFAQNLAPYHLIINPDVEINKGCIENAITYLYQHPNIGLLMPKVLYPDGQIQHLCKLLPTPFDLIFRRFVPKILAQFLKNKLQQYELQNKDYNKSLFLNNLSGCFMLIPQKVFAQIGLFDEHFFMYLEDTDLSRRISNDFDAIYLPEISIIHHYEKGSYKNKKLLVYHIKSAIYYFSKWGWFFDSDRSKKNLKVLNQTQL